MHPFWQKITYQYQSVTPSSSQNLQFFHEWSFQSSYVIRTKYRSRKWYHRIFFNLVSQCAINAWIIHHEIGGNDSCLKFLLSNAISFCSSASGVVPEECLLPSTKRFKVSYIPESMRFDRYDHWPHLVEMKNAMRCKNEDARGRPCINVRNVRCSCA